MSRWSARDLMPIMGYGRWDFFAPSIDRAKLSAEAQNMQVIDFFLAIQEKTGGRGRPREDVRLTRYAAYLVAMNGGRCSIPDSYVGAVDAGACVVP